MARLTLSLLTIIFISLLWMPSYADPFSPDGDYRTPIEKHEDYQHVLALGVDNPFSDGTNEWSPLFAYYWFGDNFDNPDLYAHINITTTRMLAIFGVKTDRIYAGVKPVFEHSTYSAWRSYNRGYDDVRRGIAGNNIGPGAFFQYNILRILSAKAFFHASYHFYHIPILTENLHKYVNVPKRHWQLKPGIELLLSDLEEKDLNRVRHGYLFRVEYNYARRIGYGTWYDYDRVFFREKYNNIWAPPTTSHRTEGVWYRSRVRDTHRLYFNAGLYYNFKGDYNLQFDFYGGYFKNVDRMNAEHIGYYQQDHAVMPGYFDTEFYHHLYLIGRIQFGIPIPFWSMRLQPGFNLLYMPKKNEVIGLREGVFYFGTGAIAGYQRLGYRGYPRTIYTSVSCGFSFLVGNLLPLFIDYAYGIDALRTGSSHNVYLNRTTRGSHELSVLVVAAFGKNE
ncbi:MAG: hypothetical protein JXA07_08300 [Spirochaetes bacterium]|nr:hypothetical protein [Spirochaetota bacterium]